MQNLLGACSEPACHGQISWVGESGRDGATADVVGSALVGWVGVRDRSSGFERLFPELNTRIHAAGVVEDQVRFIPHVTVGRVRRAPQRGRMIREAVQKADVEAVGWQVKHLTLYESRMTSSTPDYVPQASGVLRATSP